MRYKTLQRVWLKRLVGASVLNYYCHADNHKNVAAVLAGLLAATPGRRLLTPIVPGFVNTTIISRQGYIETGWAVSNYTPEYFPPYNQDLQVLKAGFDGESAPCFTLSSVVSLSLSPYLQSLLQDCVKMCKSHALVYFSVCLLACLGMLSLQRICVHSCSYSLCIGDHTPRSVQQCLKQ